MKYLSIVIILFLYFGNVEMNAQEHTLGLMLNTEDSYNGYTLFGNNQNTYLIDNCGFVVNQWFNDFRPALSKYLLPNGDLLRTFVVDPPISFGGVGKGFTVNNWDGDLIWNYFWPEEDATPHHDIEPLPNGNFLAIIWERYTEEEVLQAGIPVAGNIWSERVVEIKMLDNNEAEIVWEWKAWDHLVQDQNQESENFGVVSEHPELIDPNFVLSGNENANTDLFHFNSVDYNEELDLIVISSRTFSEIWVIDHSTTTEEAASHSGGNAGKGGDLLYRFGNPAAYGKGTNQDRVLFFQHDAKWVNDSAFGDHGFSVFSNGSINNFSTVHMWGVDVDNNYNFSINQESEIFEPSIPDWSYELNRVSPIMSSAQLLPNSNVLICEAQTGTFTEVNLAKEKVWEYINPASVSGNPLVQGATATFNQVWRATRYGVDYNAFVGQDLLPSDPIEVNPIDVECEIFLTSATEELIPESTFRVLGNPTSDYFYVESESSGNIKIVDLNGTQIQSTTISKGTHEWNLHGYPAGMYIILLEDPDGNVHQSKIIKI